MFRPVSLNADNSVPVWAVEENLRWNSNLKLSDCVGERLTLGVTLMYEYCKLAKTTQDFATKYSYNVFLRKNDSWGAFYSLLVIHWVCYRFVNVKGVPYKEDYGLGLCERTCSEVWLGKLRMTMASYLTNLSRLVS